MNDKNFDNSHSEEINRYEHRRKNIGGKASILHGYDPDTDNYYPITAVANADGTYSIKQSDPRSGYSICATSETDTYKYFFFEDAALNYYIMRKTLATNIFDYTKGTGGYASVYVDSTSGPSGSPTFASYGNTF